VVDLAGCAGETGVDKKSGDTGEGNPKKFTDSRYSDSCNVDWRCACGVPSGRFDDGAERRSGDGDDIGVADVSVSELLRKSLWEWGDENEFVLSDVCDGGECDGEGKEEDGERIDMFDIDESS